LTTPLDDDITITNSDTIITKEECPMKVLIPLGRVLFSLIFILAAPRHFTHEGIQHAADLGVPIAGLLVPISGILALAGGISVALGYKTRWGAWALVVFLVPVTFWMHAYWKLSDLAQAHIQNAMFAKNLSMLGAALLISQFGPGAFSIDAWSDG
jgi:putative oxidoreductase